jgi:hypothetical protein
MFHNIEYAVECWAARPCRRRHGAIDLVWKPHQMLMTYCLGDLGNPVIGRWNWAVRSHSVYACAGEWNGNFSNDGRPASSSPDLSPRLEPGYDHRQDFILVADTHGTDSASHHPPLELKSCHLTKIAFTTLCSLIP